MNKVFSPYLRSFVLVFFYDILVYSRSWEEHERHLLIVLEELQKQNLFVKESKCDFGKSEVSFLGHKVSKAGISVDEEKVKAVSDWPTPNSVKEVRGFLGLSGYYRRFIAGYGKLASPLTNLLKKEVGFHWGEAEQTAFQQLKLALTRAPVLSPPKFSIPFTIMCDASGNGVGAVLMQNHQPIAYYSKVIHERHL